MHVSTLHCSLFSTLHRYRYRCPVCRKGFQDRRMIQAHHRQHGRDEGPAQQAAAKALGTAAVQLMSATKPSTPELQQRGTVACSACGGRAARDDTLVCSACNQRQHWACGGLPASPTEPLPNPLCTTCLGHCPTALGEAVLGRTMAQAYAEQQGGTVWWAQPDGWCLLSCVARATGGDRVLLLQQALQVVAEGSVPTMGPEQRTAASVIFQLAVLPSPRQLDAQWRRCGIQRSGMPCPWHCPGS
eukprot:m.154696 g.154696  ORF g.154696 m.154696 type:complete len:244 (+) comp11719_c0_seq4:4513-5244(+)